MPGGVACVVSSSTAKESTRSDLASGEVAGFLGILVRPKRREVQLRV